ncbi:uncharacterized protein SEPMUDRAFT_119564 [Sphaerulina musiva SO2202]|uniref:Uncharacterized protein n=1 Tax=Sphaerulina musiva (strain SO2202) TaxID=692275 RepID=M3D008_SPHMS|nr:uncharacterized protein SEPMUDRAFT_119564 [Sphaerulina musiva SO2202]EMF09823.1 hypothetical protein SEPMUDRAFT_119564 [Sphaerulina musiva SO2202]
MRATAILLTALVAILPAMGEDSKQIFGHDDPIYGDKCNPTQYAHYCAGDLLQCSGGVCDFFSCADDLDCGELPNTFCNKKFDGCTWPGGEYLTDAQKKFYYRWGEKHGDDTNGGEPPAM